MASDPTGTQHISVKRDSSSSLKSENHREEEAKQVQEERSPCSPTSDQSIKPDTPEKAELDLTELLGGDDEIPVFDDLPTPNSTTNVLPSQQVQATRPSSFPAALVASYSNLPYGVQNHHPGRPFSLIGTAADPYRLGYGPTPTYQPHQPNPLFGGAILPGYAILPQLFQIAQGPILQPQPQHYVQPAQPAPIPHPGISPEPQGGDPEQPDPEQPEEPEQESRDDLHGEEQQQPNKRKTGQRSSPVTDFAGYPSHRQKPPGHLSCYEVCQQYPASLMTDVLLPFIQRRWSADEIFQSLPRDVVAHLESRGIDQTSMYLYKRIQKEQIKLKKSGQFIPLLNGTRIRADGRPPQITRLQSDRPPTSAWRIRHGVGIDPGTGRYVPLPSNPEANAPLLLSACTADDENMQGPLPIRSRPASTAGAASTQTNGTQPSTAQATRRRRPKQAPSKTLATPTGATQGPNAANSNYSRGRQPTRSPPPVDHTRSNARSPTLESMFPSGMINMRGAYVRTVSPGNTRVWHGAPSPEFIDNYIRDGRTRFWLDVHMPSQYRRDSPYPPLLPGDAPPGWRPTGPDGPPVVVDAAGEIDFESMQVDNEQAAAAAVGKKRKAEEMESEEPDEEADDRVKRARIEADETMEVEVQQVIRRSIEVPQDRGDDGVRESVEEVIDGLSSEDEDEDDHDEDDSAVAGDMHNVLYASYQHYPAADEGGDEDADADDEADDEAESSEGSDAGTD